MRPVVLHAGARDVIRTFPRSVRDRLGKALYLLQAGVPLDMPLSRPMASVAPGVAELRLHDKDGQYRTFYYTATAEAILVFHAFVKKTRQTPPAEIHLGRRRLKELIDEQS